MNYLEIIPKDITTIILEKYIYLNTANITNLRDLVDLYDIVKVILNENHFYISILLKNTFVNTDIKNYIIDKYNNTKINNWNTKYNMYRKFMNIFYNATSIYNNIINDKTSEDWGYAIAKFNIETLNLYFLEFDKLLYIDNLYLDSQYLNNYAESKNLSSHQFRFFKVDDTNIINIKYELIMDFDIPNLDANYAQYQNNITYNQLKYLIVILLYNNIGIYDNEMKYIT
jgi:uncharacterized membrane protein YiaA